MAKNFTLFACVYMDKNDPNYGYITGAIRDNIEIISRAIRGQHGETRIPLHPARASGLKNEASEKIVPPIIVAKNIDIVDLPQKRATKWKKLLKNLHMSEFCRTFAVAKVKTTKLTSMEAALRQPVLQYAETISEEKWDSMHTIDELDASLKSIIHNHFHG